MFRIVKTLGVVAVLGAGMNAQPAVVQEPQPAVSHASVLKGAYTAEQAKRGKQVFHTECSSCHGATEFSGTAFEEGWRDKAVGAFFGLVRGTMPEDRPGALTEQQYVDVVAFVLELNGYPAGSTELPADRGVLSKLRFDKPAAASK
jgi:mono/diheme cytochrome c family protein